MVPLMLGVMWCALRLAKEPSSKVAAGCGVLFGLLALTGNAALSLAGVVMLALIFAPASVKQRMTLSVLILAVAIVVSASVDGQEYAGDWRSGSQHQRWL